MRIKRNIPGTKLVITSLAVLALAASMSVARATSVLTFEGLQNLEPINNYYNGGTGGFGSGPGPNYGISFSSDSLAIRANSAGGTGNFGNTPSGSTIAFFLTGAGDTMNIAGGFDTGFSFFYSAVGSGSVSVWSGLNGTGTLLGSLLLTDSGNNGPSGAFYNHWNPVGVSFAGTAQSAIFSGSADYIGFDNITVGSATPSGGVPDGGGFSLNLIAGLVLASAGFIFKKKAFCC
jgi:hypothetical protein